MVLQQKIPIIPNQIVQSFDFPDLVSGLGYEDFFLSIAVIAGTNTFRIVPRSLQSGKQDLEMDQEYNFDSAVFRLPRTVKGTAYISGSIEKTAGQDANLTFRLLKVTAASAEVALTSAITLNRALGDDVPQPFFIELDLTETIIKEDEKIRLEVIPTVASSKVYIGTSPKDLAGTIIDTSATNATTITTISIPFRIDI